MAQPKPHQLGKKVTRMSFSKARYNLELPNLVEVQTKSFKWFLEKGLMEVLEDVSPITDYTGNVVCVLNPEADFKVLLAGHIDEIGLIVTHIQENGLVHVARAGGIRPLVYPGHQVVLHGYNGTIFGTVLNNKDMGKEKLEAGDLIIDIGGGTTDIAVVSLGGIVESESIKVAGDKFDEAIIRYCRRKHNVLIGERTAEEIKIKIGSAWPREEPRYLDVKGRCLIQGLPRVVRIHSHEIPNALEEPLTAVIEAICSVIERTPPELIGDILSNGIVMTGGGSLLYGLDRLINYATDIRTRVADRPIQCVAIGTGKSLDNISHIPEGSINISRMRV